MELEFKFQNGNAGPRVLHVSGSVTVKHSHEFRENLLRCLLEEDLQEISLINVDSLDITALQLLHLLKEEYKAKKKVLSFKAPQSEEITDIIRRAGLLTVFDSNA